MVFFKWCTITKLALGITLLIISSRLVCVYLETCEPAGWDRSNFTFHYSRCRIYTSVHIILPRGKANVNKYQLGRWWYFFYFHFKPDFVHTYLKVLVFISIHISYRILGNSWSYRQNKTLSKSIKTICLLVKSLLCIILSQFSTRFCWYTVKNYPAFYSILR